jgi:hypothetical protein
MSESRRGNFIAFFFLRLKEEHLLPPITNFNLKLERFDGESGHYKITDRKFGTSSLWIEDFLKAAQRLFRNIFSPPHRLTSFFHAPYNKVYLIQGGYHEHSIAP